MVVFGEGGGRCSGGQMSGHVPDDSVPISAIAFRCGSISSASAWFCCFVTLAISQSVCYCVLQLVTRRPVTGPRTPALGPATSLDRTLSSATTATPPGRISRPRPRLCRRPPPCESPASAVPMRRRRGGRKVRAFVVTLRCCSGCGRRLTSTPHQRHLTSIIIAHLITGGYNEIC